MIVYKKIPAGPRSTHNLPKYMSNRPESGLEKFHEYLANLANGGCHPDLADALTLGGIADHNVKCRWKQHVNEKKLKGENISCTVEYEDQPPFHDHSYLALLNKSAESQGLQPRFDFVTALGNDNGEVFLSKYFKQQDQRNKTVGQDKTTYLCLCAECSKFSTVVAKETKQIVENNNENVEYLQSNQDQNAMATTTRNEDSFVTRAPNQNSKAADVLPTCIPTMSPYWNPPPSNCCFPYPPFWCANKREYHVRKNMGERVLGRPPNCETTCPRNGLLW